MIAIGGSAASQHRAAGTVEAPTPAGAASTAADELIKLIKDQDPAALIAFIRECPPSEHREPILEFVRKPHAELRMMGLNMLATGYSTGPAAATALTIADAVGVGVLGRKAYEDTAKALFQDVVASAAVIAAASRATLGRPDELTAGAEAALGWLELHGSTEKSCELHLWLAETALNLGALEVTEQHLRAAEASPLSDAEYGSRDRRESLRRSCYSPASARSRGRSCPAATSSRASALS